MPSPLSPASLQTAVLARVGTHGQVGKFRISEPVALARRDRVVCRTMRGLEVGEVLGSSAGSSLEEADGRILRKMRPEDELLWGHLQELGQAAHRSCDAWLKHHHASAILIDVEPLLDGRTLYFHFLSEVDNTVQSCLDELVTLYEKQVQESKFAKLLEHGCGPGCGTSEAKNGCGSRGGCAVCKVASSCKTSAAANSAEARS